MTPRVTVRQLQEELQEVRAEVAEQHRLIDKIAHRIEPAIDELLAEVRESNGKPRPAKPVLSVVSPDEAP
jgi:hypothetical protein